MNYLLFGGASYVASFLIPRLIDKSSNVYVVVRSSSNLKRILAFKSDITLIYDDLNDADILKDKIKHLRIDYIFNFIRIGPNESYQNMLASNLFALNHILEATKEMDYLGLMHLGSGLEYGSHDRPLIEHLRDQPNTEFGLTKSMGTMRCIQFAKQHNKPILVFRIFQIYGPRDKTSRLIPTAIDHLINAKRMKITKQNFSRDWVYIDDVIDALLAVQKIKIPYGELINIATGIDTSNQKLIETLESISQKKMLYDDENMAPRVFDNESWKVDITKAKQLLNWSPKTSMRIGLKNIIETHNG